MHVLHGSWLPDSGQFAVWGEDTSLEVMPRKGKHGKTELHPFLLHQALSLSYVARFAPDAQPGGQPILLLLPGNGKRVQPSPEAQSTGAIPIDGKLTLLPWTIDAILLSPTDTLAFLLHIPLESTFMLGSDLSFWRQAALLVANCLIEQRYVPIIEQQGKLYVTRWTPRPDPNLLIRLARAMPPLCRAVVADVSTAPEPDTLLDHFLETVIDETVRSDYKPARAIREPLLKALISPDRTLAGLARTNELLYKSWQNWLEPSAQNSASTFRVCFRLDEPQQNEDETAEETNTGWPLAYMLQATDDPSLLVDAETVWSSSGKALTYLERRFDQPQEKMLMALGTASRIFPPIERSLRESSPAGVMLSAEEARQFLIDAVPRLEKDQFGVLVPKWWVKRPAIKARATLKSEASANSLLSRDALIKYQWELSIGDQQLSRKEFEQLVALKEPMVRIHGQWVVLDPAQIDAALRFLAAQAAEGDINLLDAIKLTASENTTADGITVESVAVEGWLNDLMERVRNPDTADTPTVPKRLQATLRPYQVRGFGWLAQMQRLKLGACLADDMGLGKFQPLDAKILTPNGWKLMGDMQVGDAVMNSQGGVSYVTGVYPQREQDIYQVIFSDGSSTECGDDHLWAVNTPVRKRRGNPPLILPLHEMRSRLRDAAGNSRYFIPMVCPAEFGEQELPLHPYLLGVLLGDGGLSGHTVHFTTADAEILEQVKQLIPPAVEIKKVNIKENIYDYRISHTLISHQGKKDSNPVLSALRDFGLMGCKSTHKFIPEQYRFASVQSRIALLNGLLDTDGSVSKDNAIEYATSSPRLAKDMRELAESLGGTVRLKTRIPYYSHKGEKRAGQLSYRLIIALPVNIPPFLLSRKAEKYHPRPKYQPTRAIVDIVEVGRKLAQCIAVDSPDHLYITDHYILTHNTVQTVTYWAYERERMGTDRPGLLICPTSVVGNWRHEISRFAPSLRVYTHHGADRVQGEAFPTAIADFDIVLTSYSLLSRDVETFKRVNWSSLTLDEAQNIKNSATKQAQAARAIQADQRIALTGTPVENRLSELWSILNFLNPGYLGSQQTFRTQFSIPIERYNDEKAATSLKRLTAPFILRRLKTDPKVISDLPDKFENKVYCTLTPEQATLYEAVVREELEAIEESEGIQRRGSVLRMLTRLKQICNHPAHFLKEGEALGVSVLQGRSGKLMRLTDMLEEVHSTDDRALIFTQYAEMGKHLQAYLSESFDEETLFLYGDTPIRKREEMVRQFQSPNGPTVFILSLKAGGTGLNLTHANHVFHFDRWYNPAVENQATDRAFRIGQTRNVQVHKFVCLGTLEERIDELIEHKKDLADRIVGEGEGWLSEMSNDDLRDLVTLRREAIEEAG